jgi:hypothetical protein
MGRSECWRSWHAARQYWLDHDDRSEKTKIILELTNAHLVGYETGGDIQIFRWQKF